MKRALSTILDNEIKFHIFHYKEIVLRYQNFTLADVGAIKLQLGLNNLSYTKTTDK
jgi:hypothetical protein